MPAAFRQQRQRRTLIFSLLLWLLTLKSLVPLILAADEIVATAGADGSGGGGLGVSSTTVFGKFKIVRERDERRREEQRRRASAVSVPHLQQHQQQFHSDPCLLRCKDDYVCPLLSVLFRNRNSSSVHFEGIFLVPIMLYAYDLCQLPNIFPINYQCSLLSLS